MAEIRIIGTAHVSQKSVDEVREAVEEFPPDIIAVELDPARFGALKKSMAEPSVSDVIETGNFTQLLVQWTLSYLQRKIGMDVGVEPGAEMKAVIALAMERHLGIGLIDRDIRITLARFWKSMLLWEKLKMFYALSVSVAGLDGEEIDIESLKQEDVIALALTEFRKFSPNGARALIDERDAYLAHQLRALDIRGGKVLAVIGAEHVKGVQRYMNDPITLPPLSGLTTDIKSPPWGLIFGGGGGDAPVCAYGRCPCIFRRGAECAGCSPCLRGAHPRHLHGGIHPACGRPSPFSCDRFCRLMVHVTQSFNRCRLVLGNR